MSCGKEVTISGKYTVLVITILFLLFIGSKVMNPDPLYILIFGSIVAIVYSIVQIYLVPLSKNKIDEFL